MHKVLTVLIPILISILILTLLRIFIYGVLR